MDAVTVKPFSRFCSFWFPVIACMGLIFYASSLPGKVIPSLFPHQDILFHGSIYAVLGLFFFRALKNTFNRFVLFKLLIFTVIFGFVYGATDEFHQLFTPGRECSLFDLAVDTIGSSIGGIIGVYFHKWLK
jgi:VanZ family protein